MEPKCADKLDMTVHCNIIVFNLCTVLFLNITTYYCDSRAGVNSKLIGIDQFNSRIAAGTGIERFGTKRIELELKYIELNQN